MVTFAQTPEDRRDEIIALANIRQPVVGPDEPPMLVDDHITSHLVAIMDDALEGNVANIGKPGKHGKPTKTDNMRANRIIALRWLTNSPILNSTNELLYSVGQVLVERWGKGFRANSLALFEVPLFRDQWLLENQVSLPKVEEA